MRACILAYMHTYIRAYIHTNIHTNMDTRTNGILMHACIRTYTHIHLHLIQVSAPTDTVFMIAINEKWELVTPTTMKHAQRCASIKIDHQEIWHQTVFLIPRGLWSHILLAETQQ
jgi:hypothetical protein